VYQHWDRRAASINHPYNANEYRNGRWTQTGGRTFNPYSGRQKAGERSWDANVRRVPPRPPASRPATTNNVFAGKNGHVYRYNPSGHWESNTPRGWQNAERNPGFQNQNRELNQQRSSRSMGQQMFNNSRSSGSFRSSGGHPSGGAPRGGGGSPGGGGSRGGGGSGGGVRR